MDEYLRKALLSLGVALVVVYTARAGPTVVEGEVSASAAWSGQVLIKGNVQILQGVTVSIAGGTQVMFESGANLYVQGTLVANGNVQTAPIYFMPATQGQAWGAIYFYGAPANCQMNGCIITGAQVGIYCLSSAPTINASYIYGCQYGIFVGEGGTPNIMSSYLMKNAAAVVLQGSTAGVNIQNCFIQENNYGVYGVQFAQARITGCQLKQNTAHIINAYPSATIEATGNQWDDGAPPEQVMAKIYDNSKGATYGPVNHGLAVAAAPGVPPVEEEAPVEEEEEAPPEEPVITFEKRPAGGAFVRGLVPGLGQFYNGRMIKGIIVPVGFVMNAGMSVYAKMKSNSLYEEYEDPKTTKTAAKAVELYDQQDMYLQWWNIGKFCTVGWYFYGLFDAISDAMVQPVENPRSIGVTAGISWLGFGVGQMYNRRYLKGAFCAIAELATIVSILQARGGFNENYDKYKEDAVLDPPELTVQEANEVWAEAGVFEHRNDFLVTYVLPLMHIYGGLDAILDCLNDRRLAGGSAGLYKMEPYFEYASRPQRLGGEMMRMGLTLDF